MLCSVFADKIGQPLKLNTLRYWHFRPALERAELPSELTMYSLRHAYAGLLLRSGESIKSVSHWLGHSNTSVTLDVYAHFIDQSDDRAASRIEAALYDG